MLLGIFGLILLPFLVGAGGLTMAFFDLPPLILLLVFTACGTYGGMLLGYRLRRGRELAAIMILFMHNWFSLLAHGADNLEGNDPAWIIWAVVDTMLPIALGVTGCRMWCDASPSKSNS